MSRIAFPSGLKKGSRCPNFACTFPTLIAGAACSFRLIPNLPVKDPRNIQTNPLEDVLASQRRLNKKMCFSYCASMAPLRHYISGGIISKRQMRDCSYLLLHSAEMRLANLIFQSCGPFVGRAGEIHERRRH